MSEATGNDNDNGGGGDPIQCSVCRQVNGPFSNRQRNRAMMGESARCRKCIDRETKEDLPSATARNKDDTVDVSTENVRSKATGSEELSTIKERKRDSRKEKKKAKKQRLVNEEGASPSSSCFNSNDENHADFSNDENTGWNTKTAKPQNDSDQSLKNEENQFSDTEDAVEMEMDATNKENETNSSQKPAAAAEDSSELKIPRKSKAQIKDDTRSTSLIANVQPAKPKADTPEIMHVDEKEEEEEEQEFRGSDQEEEDDDDGPSTSLTDLKRKILGRDLQTHENHEDNHVEDDRKPAAKTMISQNVPSELRKDLCCSICHEPFLDPVSLLCGHNFCSECMNWWLQSSTRANNCPTCRREMPEDDAASLGVNTALRACVVALLGNELEARLAAVREAERQATKGENEGAHDRGYEVLKTTDQDTWKKIGSWQCRRSIVLDADDQRMQLALGIWEDATRIGIYFNPHSQTLQVSVCLLTMEEDEVEDTGFPPVVQEEEDDNEHLLVTRYGGRFVHSFIQTMAKGAGRNIPLGRRAIQVEGIAAISLQLGQEDMADVHTISFRHEESGAVLELKVPPNLDLHADAASEGNSHNRRHDRASGRTAATAVEVNEYDGGENDDGSIASEDDGSHLDHYENDGFIADEAEDDQDEEDLCWSCREGGDLMICDGGDHVEGCGKSFHIECVSRDIVPRGDWICEDCAHDLALDVGVEGHEFPPEGETLVDSDENEDDLVESSSPRMKRKRKDQSKEVVDIHCSDSDEDDRKMPSKANGNSDRPTSPSAQADTGSDEDNISENEIEKPATRKPSKRICIIDDSDDE